MRRGLHILLCLIMITGCTGNRGIQAGTPELEADVIPDGPGILSGQDGEFSVLGNDGKVGSFSDNAPGSQATDAPVIWNSWQNMFLSLDQCLARAETALRNADFGQGLSMTETSAYGVNGLYRSVVRCAPSKQAVFFIVSGPTGGTAENFMKSVRANF